MKWGVCSAAFRPYLVPGIRAEARTTNMFTIACVVLLPHFIRLKCYIVSNPKVMMGKPVVAGTRITVEFIL